MCYLDFDRGISSGFLREAKPGGFKTRVFPTFFRNQEKGVFRRGFLQDVRLSWPWRSECQMNCWAQYPWIFFVALGVTLDSAETPFAKTPFSWFLIFPGKVQIVSRTLSGLFLVGALNRPRKRKRTDRENPWTIPEQIGKIPEKSGKSQKGQKRTKKEGQVQIGKPARLKPPCLAALEIFTPRYFFHLFRLGPRSQGLKICHNILFSLEKRKTKNSTQNPPQFPSFLKFLAETSIAKSVTTTRKIRREFT